MYNEKQHMKLHDAEMELLLNVIQDLFEKVEHLERAVKELKAEVAL